MRSEQRKQGKDAKAGNSLTHQRAERESTIAGKRERGRIGKR